MSDKLILAIPSKGRLKEKTQEVFRLAGYEISSPFGDRNYRGLVKGHENIEVAFLSASEIAREIARGKVHLGVTGEDLVKENISNYQTYICQLQPLGFGHANVVIALPESWIDVLNIDDLDDVAASYRKKYGRRLRIATKYWNLTQRFFAQHGIASYRIVESLGATEGAPSAGLADAIVDITSTGSTLKANHLKTLDEGIILKSQANLFSSKAADWSKKQCDCAAEIVESLSQSLSNNSTERVVIEAARLAKDSFLKSLPS